MKLVLDQQPSGGATLFPDTPPTVYSPEYAQQKADKLAVTLGQANPGHDILTSDVNAGLERQWLETLKNQEDNANLAQRNRIIEEIASSRTPGTPIAREELDLVQNLSRDELYSSDVQTILEKKYADLYTTQLLNNEESAVAQEAFIEEPDAAAEVVDRSQFPMQKVQIIEDVLQNTKAKYDETSWASWGADLAKSVIIPGYDTLKNRELVETGENKIFLGENMDDQIDYLWSLPPEQFKTTLEETINTLAQDNIIAAMDYIQKVQRYSTGDKAWDNITTGLDIFGGIGTVASAIKTASKAGKLAKGLSNMGKVINTSPTKLPQLAAQAGFNKTAAVGQVTQDLLSGDLSGATTVSRIEEIGDKLPTLFNPEKIMEGGTRLDAEATARLKQAVIQSSDEVLTAVRTGNLVDRLEPTQIMKAVQQAQSEVEQMFPSNVHNIIDTSVEAAASDRITNTAVAVTKFGRKDGSLFKYEATAKRFADTYIGLKTDDYKIMQDTLGGYYVEVRRPLADVGDWRRLNIETTLSTPETINGAFARGLRSPDYFLPKAQTQARGTVVHTQELLSKTIDEVTKPFRGKPKQWYDEMDAMMTASQVNRRYFQNVGEFETAFLKKFNKVPTEDQYEAYFRYRQINDLDYMLRDADVVKKLTAKGFREFRQNVIAKDGSMTDERIVGRRVEQLPATNRPFKIRVIQNNKETNKFSSFSKNWNKNKELLDKLMAEGYKIIEHSDKPLYTITRDFKDNSIKMNTLGYKEGGHFIQKYDFYISQGKFEDIDGFKAYNGDINLGTAVTQKQANEIAKLFDDARKLVRDNAPNAQKFIEENLPISYGDFIKKVKAGAIDLDAPILGRKSGTDTAATAKYEAIFPEYMNWKGSEYNPLAETSGRFTQERSDELLDVYTTNGKQVFQQDWSPILSPMDALASATRNMINVRVLEDYAIKSANDWIQEHGHKLNVDLETLKANPRYYMRNPVYRGAKDDAAEASRLAHLSLFNEVDLGDISKVTLKDKFLNKAFDVAPEWLQKNMTNDSLYSARDVTTFLRASAFHMKLGFWNPKQLFLQGSAAMNALAISPRAGWSGINVATMTRLALYSGSDEVISGLYNKFGKISGWEKQDWIDMVKSMKQSGFGNIGGDMAYLDNMSTKGAGKAFMGQMKEGVIGSISKTSTAPFTEGELFARATAYGTAWREWKMANPGKTPDRFGQASILQRAKDMGFNMTRDSNAAWQRGNWSVMTQFWSYQARVAEAMWDGGIFKNGQKLSKAEKLRLAGLMSTLYGGGTAVSMGTVFIPTTEVIKGWLLEQGVDTEQYPGAELFLDGAPATLMKGMLGADMDFSTYGPTGLPTLADLINGDKTFGDFLLGASGGVAIDTLGPKGLYGLAVKLGYEEGALTVDDVMSVFRNISTVDTATKAWIGINAGKWISKNGTYITDINIQEALTGAIFGVSPMSVTDTYLQMNANRKFKDARTGALRDYAKASELANRALEAGNTDDYLVYRKRRDTIGILYDLTPSERASVARRTLLDTSVSQKVSDEADKIERRYKTFTETK